MAAGLKYTPDEKAAWDRAIESIKQDIPKVAFDLWFSALSLYSVSPTTIVMEHGDAFSMHQLQQRYSTMLYSVFTTTFGTRHELEFYTHEEILHMHSGLEKTMLMPKYTFDNFVVGPSNTFAYNAAMAVAEQPTKVYNPLFIHGGVGLGKTHLMNAIGNYVIAHNPNANILFISSETFTNELIDTIAKKKGTSELRDRMRNVDVLMVDDIQFLSRTVVTQEEFFHTFNELHSKGKQIILSSDRPPKDIPTIEERLRSRFSWGLIVDIQQPDFETRVAILRKKAEEERIQLPGEVVDFIATRIENNIRELEGALNRVHAQSMLMKVPINVDLAQDALRQVVRNREKRTITPDCIIRTVARCYGIREEDLLSEKRKREFSVPRQIAMYLTRELTALSTPSIGAAFGGRDHTTVMHGCEKIAKDLREDDALRKKLDELAELIKKD